MKRFITLLCVCKLLMSIMTAPVAAAYEIEIVSAEIYSDIVQVTYDADFTSTTVNMFVAAYGGNNTMLDVSMRTIPEGSYEIGGVENFTLDGNENAAYFKVFCLEDGSIRPVAEAKRVENTQVVSLQSYLSQHSEEYLEYYTHTLSENILTIPFGESFYYISDSISVITGLEDVISRASIACYDATNVPLSGVSITNAVWEIEEIVPYARFVITDKQDASDRFEVIVKQANDSIMIYGTPPKAKLGEEYSYQLSISNDGYVSNFYELTEGTEGLKGLAVRWDGLIYGTPTESGVCEFTVTSGQSSRRLRIIIMSEISFTQPLATENSCDNFSLSVPESEAVSGRTLSVQSATPTDDSVLQCANVDVMDGNGAVTQIDGMIMTMNFDPDVVRDRSIEAAYYDETSGKWQTQTADIDYNSGIATIYTDHLSLWGLIFGSDATIYRGMGSAGDVIVKYNSDNDCNVGSKVYTQKEMAHVVATTFAQSIYPKFNSWFGGTFYGILSGPQTIRITIMRNDPDGADGYSDGSFIYLNGSNYESWGQVYSTLFHEYFHIIQAKYIGTRRMARSSELWFTEGAADIFAAACTAEYFPNEKGSFVNLTGKKLPLQWFDDITAHNGVIEYASSYFAGFVARERLNSANRLVFKNKGGKICIARSSPDENMASSIALGLSAIYTEMKNESKSIDEVVPASSLVRFMKFYLIDYPQMYPENMGFVRPFDTEGIVRDMYVNNIDDNDNYMSVTTNVSQSRPGIKVFKLSNNASDKTRQLYATVSADASLKSYSVGMLNATGIIDGKFTYDYDLCTLGTNERFFRPFSVNTDFTDSYVLMAKMSSGFFSGSNTYNITLGNMGGMTGDNISLQFTETPIEGSDRFSVSCTATYVITTATASLGATGSSTFDIGSGTAGTALTGIAQLEISADGYTVGKANKKYSYKIVGQ